jgi:hypothetical protein
VDDLGRNPQRDDVRQVSSDDRAAALRDVAIRETVIHASRSHQPAASPTAAPAPEAKEAAAAPDQSSTPVPDAKTQDADVKVKEPSGASPGEPDPLEPVGQPSTGTLEKPKDENTAPSQSSDKGDAQGSALTGLQDAQGAARPGNAPPAAAVERDEQALETPRENQTRPTSPTAALTPEAKEAAAAPDQSSTPVPDAKTQDADVKVKEPSGASPGEPDPLEPVGQPSTGTLEKPKDENTAPSQSSDKGDAQGSALTGLQDAPGAERPGNSPPAAAVERDEQVLETPGGNQTRPTSPTAAPAPEAKEPAATPDQRSSPVPDATTTTADIKVKETPGTSPGEPHPDPSQQVEHPATATLQKPKDENTAPSQSSDKGDAQGSALTGLQDAPGAERPGNSPPAAAVERDEQALETPGGNQTRPTSPTAAPAPEAKETAAAPDRSSTPVPDAKTQDADVKVKEPSGASPGEPDPIEPVGQPSTGTLEKPKDENTAPSQSSDKGDAQGSALTGLQDAQGAARPGNSPPAAAVERGEHNQLSPDRLESVHFEYSLRPPPAPDSKVYSGQVPGYYLPTPDATGRVVSVEGWLTLAPGDPPSTDGTPGKDRGHLIGEQFGGKGDSSNIVDIDPRINRSFILTYEERIADHVRDGKQLYMRVRVEYDPQTRLASALNYDLYEAGNGWHSTMRIDPNSSREYTLREGLGGRSSRGREAQDEAPQTKQVSQQGDGVEGVDGKAKDDAPQTKQLSFTGRGLSASDFVDPYRRPAFIDDALPPHLAAIPKPYHELLANATDPKLRDANEINDVDHPDFHPPYSPDVPVVEATLGQSASLWRVHSADNQTRSWLIAFDPSEYSGEQIQHMLAIPWKPSHVSQVDLSAGVRVRIGEANPFEDKPQTEYRPPGDALRGRHEEGHVHCWQIEILDLRAAIEAHTVSFHSSRELRPTWHH